MLEKTVVYKSLNMDCCKPAMKTFAVIVLIIGVYSIILVRTKSMDFMNKKFVDITLFNEPCCSLWAVSHFVLYFVLGIMFPNCQVLFIIMGVLWELTESTIGYFTKSFFNKINTDGGEYKDWMSGSFRDVILNVLGLYMGIFIKKWYDREVTTEHVKTPNYPKNDIESCVSKNTKRINVLLKKYRRSE